NQKLLPALSRENIRILPLSKLNSRQRDEADLFYARQVDPLLSPVTIDPAHPFPHVLNKALCVAFLLRRRGRASGPYVGVVTVPRQLPPPRAHPRGRPHQFLLLACPDRHPPAQSLW